MAVWPRGRRDQARVLLQVSMCLIPLNIHEMTTFTRLLLSWLRYLEEIERIRVTHWLMLIGNGNGGILRGQEDSTSDQLLQKRIQG